MQAIRSPLKQHCKQIGKCHVTFFVVLNMQKTVICISHRIHHCINIKDWWKSVRSLEYWRNLFYAVRRGGKVQCRAISDLLMLNPELNLHTHKFTCRVHGESPWRAVQHAIYTAVSGDTHLSISRWIIEGTPPPPCFLHCLELVVAPEYKDHVALVVRGVNLFKFLFAHVVFLVISPLFFSSPPMNQLLSLGTLLPPWRLFSKGFSPRTQLNRNFHAPAHRHTFHFLVSYYSLISLFCFFLVEL